MPGQFDNFQPSATDPLQQFLRNSAGGGEATSQYAPGLVPYTQAVPQTPKGINSPAGAADTAPTPPQQVGPAAGAVIPPDPTQPAQAQLLPAQPTQPTKEAQPAGPEAGAAGILGQVPGLGDFVNKLGSRIGAAPANQQGPAEQAENVPPPTAAPGMKTPLQPMQQQSGVQNYSQGWMTPSGGWGG